MREGISPLKGYVFSAFARLATYYDFGGGDSYYGSAGNFWTMADGTGQWFMSWMWWPVSKSPEYERQAGFVFRYSNDGVATDM
jgi:hypothetical protein